MAFLSFLKLFVFGLSFSLVLASIEYPLFAIDDVYSVQENSPLTCFNVIENDIGLGIVNSTLSIVQSPSDGGFANVTGGEICYQPLPFATQSETLTYKVCDLYSFCSEAVVTLIINVVHYPPFIENDNYTLNQWDFLASFDVLANDWDNDSPFLMDSFQIVQSPTYGEAYIDTANFTIIYTPYPRFFGNDTLAYNICDYFLECSIGYVFINVLQKCYACETCNQYQSTFTLQTQKIESSFAKFFSESKK